MEGRHYLPNTNTVSGLPQFSLFFFEQIYSSLNTKIPPTTCSVSFPEPPNNSCRFWGIPEMLCFFSSFSSEHEEVSVFTLRIRLPSFARCSWHHTAAVSSPWGGCHGCCRHMVRPATTSLCVDGLWRPPHNYELGPAVTVCEKQQLPLRSGLSRSWIWGFQANTKAKHH